MDNTNVLKKDKAKIVSLYKESGALHLNKLAVRRTSSIIFLDYSTITYVHSEGNYCIVHNSDGKVYILSQSLKEVTQSITSNFFYRVHASYLVNLKYLQKILKKNQWKLMIKGDLIPVSRSKVKDLKNILKI